MITVVLGWMRLTVILCPLCITSSDELRGTNLVSSIVVKRRSFTEKVRQLSWMEIRDCFSCCKETSYSRKARQSSGTKIQFKSTPVKSGTSLENYTHTDPDVDGYLEDQEPTVDMVGRKNH